MKPQLSAQMLTVSAIALSAITTMSQPSSAQTITYYCGTSDGVPTTFARNVIGNRIPVIRWVYGFGNEYTPQRRCEEVSPRFQSAYDKGVLSYITSGIKGGQQVVCAASEYGGPCSQLLFTLKPGQNANKVVQDLFNIGYRARGPIVQSSDGSPQTYIDMNLVMGQTPAK